MQVYIPESPPGCFHSGRSEEIRGAESYDYLRFSVAKVAFNNRAFALGVGWFV